ncbi:ribosome quality control complex subunit TCF25-like [Babylonia areolata]|uniref:ribosome quality control complex subunit TCF25-like n=1 Tax=Babylonia areolata TaxID=304850 RepID=UPI003FD20EA7
MSNRAMRRLYKEADMFPVPGGCEEEEDEEEESPPQPAARKKKSKKRPETVNPFELLAESGDVEEETEEAEKEEEVSDAAVSKSSEVSLSSSSKKKRQKKKKKKKAEEALSSQALETQVEDEIEASVQEVNRILGDAGLNPSDARDHGNAQFTVNMKALLNIEYKYLNADNELRRKFGSRVVQAEQGRPRQRNRVPQRQSRLVQPKDNWPHFGRTGHHSDAAQTAEQGSSEAEPSGQPKDNWPHFGGQNLMQDHPYHIDSLIQLSEVFHINEDPQTAVDLIERALYVMEGASHPRFNMAAGNCRLDFRRQENRAMFLALFKHLVAVSQRGCHRTALELCKLLLSLDPDGDPMCVLLMIDFYALRCQQYAFLLRLFEEWESFRNLSQLPNFAFSVPLALFHLGKDNPAQASRADRMLEESLLMFPGLLMTLLDKCGVSPDQQVSRHAFFGPAAQASQTPALQQLVALYVGRTHTLWKEGAVMGWVERVVRDTLRLVDAKDPRVDSFAEKRKTRYQGTPRNIYRHLIVSNIKDATAALPPELTNTPVLTYDPLPPLDAIVSYSRPERPRMNTEEGENMLSLFLRSLLPNFNAQGGNQDDMGGGGGGGGGQMGLEEEEEGEGGAAGGGGGNHELRHGVGALMDAMRDLLNNIRLAPPPVDNPAGDGGEGEEEGAGEEWD